MNAIRFNYIHLYSNALKVCILLISRSKVFGWGGGLLKVPWPWHCACCARWRGQSWALQAST